MLNDQNMVAISDQIINRQYGENNWHKILAIILLHFQCEKFVKDRSVTL